MTPKKTEIKNKWFDKENFTRFIIIVPKSKHKRMQQLAHDNYTSMQAMYAKAVDEFLKNEKSNKK